MGDQKQQLLNIDAPISINREGSVPPASDTKSLRRLVFGMGIIILINCVLISVLILELRGARNQATELHNQVLPVLPVVKSAASIIGATARLIHGNVPDMVNALIQTNYQTIGLDVYKAASKVLSAVDDSFDSGLLSVAKYASLVKSISARVNTMKPDFPSPPSADPDGDGGILGIISYASQWADTQTNLTSIVALANTCVAMVDTMMNTDLSGYYTWGQGSYYGTWDVNGGMRQYLPKIMQYCVRISKITPQSLEGNLSLPNAAHPSIL